MMAEMLMKGGYINVIKKHFTFELVIFVLYFIIGEGWHESDSRIRLDID